MIDYHHTAYHNVRVMPLPVGDIVVNNEASTSDCTPSGLRHNRLPAVVNRVETLDGPPVILDNRCWIIRCPGHSHPTNSS